MNKEFASNAILIVALNLFVKGFYLFGIDRTVQNILPEGEYGLYFTLFNFAFLFQIVSDFGLQNYNARHLAGSRQLLSKYFPHLLGLKFSLGLIFLLLVGASGYLWGFNSSYTWLLLLIIAINQLLQTTVLFFRSNLAGLGLYRLDSFASILDKSLLVIISALLIWGPKQADFELHWFVLAHTAAYLISIFVLYNWLKPKIKKPHLRLDSSRLVYFLKASSPYALIIFLMTAYTRVDVIMLEKIRLDGLIQADRYASAYRLLDAVNIGGFLLAGLLLPMFARQIKLKEDVKPLVDLSIALIWTGALALIVAVYQFAPQIMAFLYTDATEQSAEILQWLILSFWAMSGTYVYGTLLTAHGSLRAMNMIFAASIIVNLGLNLYLIPDQGASGAALATFVTQSVAFIALFLLAHLQMKLAFNKKLYLLLILYTSCLFFSLEYAKQYFSSYNWILIFAFSFIFALLLAFSLRILKVKAWIKLLKQ